MRRFRRAPSGSDPTLSALADPRPICRRIEDCAGFAPAAVLPTAPPSKVAFSKVSPFTVRMEEGEDAPVEEAPAEGSILDSLSGLPAELLEKIKGMTMLEASELIKEAEKAFNVGAGADSDDAEEEAPAAEE